MIRLTATKAMEQISQVCKEEDSGAYERMNYPPDLLSKYSRNERRRSEFLESFNVRVDLGQHIKQRIEEIRVINSCLLILKN